MVFSPEEQGIVNAQLTSTSHRKNLKLINLAQTLSRSEAEQTNTGQDCYTNINKIWAQPSYDYTTIIGSKKNFTDPDFDLTVDGMWWPQYNTKSTDPFSNYDIVRARDRLPKGTLFGDSGKVLPTDMAQGALGDCYFIASCAATAEWEARVKKMFVT